MARQRPQRETRWPAQAARATSGSLLQSTVRVPRTPAPRDPPDRRPPPRDRPARPDGSPRRRSSRSEDRGARGSRHPSVHPDRLRRAGAARCRRSHRSRRRESRRCRNRPRRDGPDEYRTSKVRAGVRNGSSVNVPSLRRLCAAALYGKIASTLPLCRVMKLAAGSRCDRRADPALRPRRSRPRPARSTTPCPPARRKPADDGRLPKDGTRAGKAAASTLLLRAAGGWHPHPPRSPSKYPNSEDNGVRSRSFRRLRVQSECGQTDQAQSDECDLSSSPFSCGRVKRPVG